MEPTQPKLLDQIAINCRTKGYSPKTAETYRHWCEEFLRYHRTLSGQWIHPKDMSKADVEVYLTHLAVVRRVSPTTQNVALQSMFLPTRRVIIRYPSRPRPRRPMARTRGGS